MDIQKFRETYKQVITESNDSEFRNYIKSVVEEILKEMNNSETEEMDSEEEPEDEEEMDSEEESED